MERKDVAESSIQKLLGHESRLTTEFYLHSLGESAKEAMAISERSSPEIHTQIHTLQ